MTQTVSGKNRKFWHNFNEKIRKNIKLLILITFLHFCGTPLITAGALIGNITGSKDSGYDALWVIGILATAAAIILCIPVILDIFGYMFKKTHVDMEISLPLSTEEKFFSDLLASLAVNLLPFLICQVITAILGAVGYAVFDGKVIARTEDTIKISEFFGEIGPTFISVVTGIFLVILSLTAMLLFMICCCGSLFEIIAYTGLFNILIPAVFYLFPTIFGLYSIYPNDLSWLMDRTSPAGGLLAVFDCFDKYFVSGEIGFPERFGSFVICMLIAALIFAVPSFFLYKSRKPEQAGKPFAFKLFLTLVEFGSLMIISTFIYKSPETGTPSFIICIIVFIVMEAFAGRKSLNAVRCAVKLAAMSAVIAGVIFVSDATGCFGAIYYVPDVKDIKSAEVLDIFQGGSTIMETDEGKEMAVSFQKDLIEYYKDNKSVLDKYSMYYDEYLQELKISSEEGQMLSEYYHITYTLKSGRTINRWYTCEKNTFIEKLIGIRRSEDGIRSVTDSYRKGILEWAKEAAVNDSGEYNISLSSPLYDGMDMNLSKKISVFGDDTNFVVRLADALEADIRAETDEQYYRRPVPLLWIQFPHYRTITVYPYFENTVKVLSEKADVPAPDEKLTLKNLIGKYNRSFNIISPEDIEEYCEQQNLGDRKNITVTWDDVLYDFIRDDSYALHFDYLKDTLSEEEYKKVTEDCVTLANNIYTVFYDNEDGYYFADCGTGRGVIPKEYSEMAEALLKYEISVEEYRNWQHYGTDY